MESLTIHAQMNLKVGEMNLKVGEMKLKVGEMKLLEKNQFI